MTIKQQELHPDCVVFKKIGNDYIVDNIHCIPLFVCGLRNIRRGAFGVYLTLKKAEMSSARSHCVRKHIDYIVVDYNRESTRHHYDDNNFRLYVGINPDEKLSLLLDYIKADQLTKDAIVRKLSFITKVIQPSTNVPKTKPVAKESANPPISSHIHGKNFVVVVDKAKQNGEITKNDESQDLDDSTRTNLDGRYRGLRYKKVKKIVW